MKGLLLLVSVLVIDRYVCAAKTVDLSIPRLSTPKDGNLELKTNIVERLNRNYDTYFKNYINNKQKKILVRQYMQYLILVLVFFLFIFFCCTVMCEDYMKISFGRIKQYKHDIIERERQINLQQENLRNIKKDYLETRYKFLEMQRRDASIVNYLYYHKLMDHFSDGSDEDDQLKLNGQLKMNDQLKLDLEKGRERHNYKIRMYNKWIDMKNSATEDGHDHQNYLEQISQGWADRLQQFREEEREQKRQDYANELLNSQYLTV